MLPIIETIPLQALASGDRLSLQVYKYVGAQPGKKVYIQSNLHGNEIAGNPVIYHLMDMLNSLDSGHLKGEIWLVPLCNPVGVNQRTLHYSTGRFNHYDGQNWNRIFWDYTNTNPDLKEFAQSQVGLDIGTIQTNYRQCIQAAFHQLLDEVQSPFSVPFDEKYRYILQSLCSDADYVIDLHTSVDQGVDYVYYFQGRQDSAPFFLLDLAILLDRYDGNAFDEAFIKPWLALESCLAELGQPVQFDIEAWTLELGTGMQANPESVTAGFRGVNHYLLKKGVLTEPLAGASVQLPSNSALPGSTTRLVSRHQAKRYYAPVGGTIYARASLRATVEAGATLYQLLCFNKDGQLPTIVDVPAAESGFVFDVSTNQSVNEGEYVIGVITAS
jgi:uncharacterized protein